MEFQLGNRVIGGTKPFVIAEIGHNHQGNLNTAIELIHEAAKAGCDAVKFQKKNVDTLYHPTLLAQSYDTPDSFGKTYGEHKRHLEFSYDDFVQLRMCAEDNDLEFFSTPFDMESVDFLTKLGATCFKVASGDLTNLPLLRYIASKGKPMFVSTGAANDVDVLLADKTIREIRPELPVVFLHCVAGYPAPYETLNLLNIKSLEKQLPDRVIGYSGHDSGILAPVLAYMLGAKVIEKHFTLNRANKGTDHKYSLEPASMRKLIRDLRRTHLAMGAMKKIFSPMEHHARRKMSKSPYTIKDVIAGEPVSDSIIYQIPWNEDSFTPAEFEAISINGRYTRNLVQGELIRKGDVA